MAVWRYSHCNHKLLPDDLRLNFALAIGVLRLAPYERKPARIGSTGKPRFMRATRAEKLALGAELRQKLAPVFANITLALEARHEAERKRVADLRTPFDA